MKANTQKKLIYGVIGVIVAAGIVAFIIWARGLGKEQPKPSPTPSASAVLKTRGLSNERFGPRARAQNTANIDVGVRTTSNANATPKPTASPAVRRAEAIIAQLAATASPMASPRTTANPVITPPPPATLPNPPTFSPLAPAPSSQGREAVIVYSKKGDNANRQVYLRSLERDKDEQLVTSVYDDYGVSFSSSSQKVAFYSNEEGPSDAARPRAKLKVFDLANGKVTTIASNLPGAWPAAWSSDGKKLAVPTNNSIFIADVTAGNALQVPTGRNPGAISWAPGNLKFYFQADGANQSGDIFEADAITAQARSIATNPATERLPSVSGDGTKLSFLRDDQEGATVIVRNVIGGDEQVIKPATPADSYLWNFDFTTLVAGQKKDPVQVIRVKGQEVKPYAELGNPTVVSWDRDYQHVFVLADDDQGKSLFTLNLETGQAEKVKAGISDAVPAANR